MREFINKHVKILIDIDGKKLFFHAIVISVSETHISFIDKFQKPYAFLVADVRQISLDEDYETHTVKT